MAAIVSESRPHESHAGRAGAERRCPLPRIDLATGLLIGVRQVLSPFYDARPAGVLPELIVVHGISLPPGEFGGPWIDRLFTGNLPAGRPPVLRRASRACGSRRTC